MKQNQFILLYIAISSLHNDLYSKTIDHINGKATVEHKVIKQTDSHKFVRIDKYADMQTCYINRPTLQTSTPVFTLAQHNKPHHYNAPDMNQWAADNPRVRTYEIGTLHINNRSFPLTASCSHHQDPFRKPLPGPR